MPLKLQVNRRRFQLEALREPPAGPARAFSQDEILVALTTAMDMDMSMTIERDGNIRITDRKS
jgi:hypothetical protein